MTMTKREATHLAAQYRKEGQDARVSGPFPSIWRERVSFYTVTLHITDGDREYRIATIKDLGEGEYYHATPAS